MARLWRWREGYRDVFQNDVLCSHRPHTSSASGAILTDGGAQTEAWGPERFQCYTSHPRPRALRVSVLQDPFHNDTPKPLANLPFFVMNFPSPFPVAPLVCLLSVL